jgi:hypothetical protein
MVAAKSFFEKNLSQNLFASVAAAREFAAGPGDWIGGVAGVAGRAVVLGVLSGGIR